MDGRPHDPILPTINLSACTTPHPLTSTLLHWYGQNSPGLCLGEPDPNPYSTWLSEVILQQTRVDQGTAYWERFMAAFPTVQDLACGRNRPSHGLVEGAWAITVRARNLQKAARKSSWVKTGAMMPKNAEEWAALPGVGPYTAAAISSICYGEAGSP